MFVQRRGLFTGVLEFLRKIGLKIGYLEAREEKLRSLDRMILEFYRHNRPAVYASTGLFFLSWMAEALEVYVFISLSGGPAMALLRHLYRRPLRLYQRQHLLHPRQPWRPRRRELVLTARLSVTSDVAGITFALLRTIPGDGMDRDRATVSSGAAWACGGNSGKSHCLTQEMAPDAISSPSSSLAAAVQKMAGMCYCIRKSLVEIPNSFFFPERAWSPMTCLLFSAHRGSLA